MEPDPTFLRATAERCYGIRVRACHFLGRSENTAYALHLEDGNRLFLRLHPFSERYADYLAGEIQLLDTLAAQTGTEHIHGVRNLEQAEFTRFEFQDTTWILALFAWTDGEHVPAHELKPQHVSAMGETVGRFHLQSKRLSQRFKRPAYDFEYFFGNRTFYGRNDLNQHVAADLMLPFEEIKSRFMHQPPESYETGMIHYDLHPGNVLFTDSCAALIDFDECGYGPYLFDLGHMLLAIHDHDQYPELESHLLEAYEQQGHPRISQHDLPLFKCLQAVASMHYFFRVWDRSAGEIDLFHLVPNLSSTTADLLNG